jgi:ABC-type antimicrobial peptide transport system permease subunit
VNETAAKQYWGKESAVGHRFYIGEDRNRVPVEVVGVVGDVHTTGLEASSRPDVYFSYKQFPVYDTTLVVRSSSDIVGLEEFIRRTAKGLNEGMLIIREKTVKQIVSDSIRQTKFRTILMTIFSIAALVIAAIGMYGMMSYSVEQRIHEIGVRTALGANPYDIMKMVIRQGARVAVTGVLIGLLMTLVLTRFLESSLFGVKENDPATLLIATVFLMLVGLTACLVPARRAARVDPVIALRYE